MCLKSIWRSLKPSHSLKSPPSSEKPTPFLQSLLPPHNHNRSIWPHPKVNRRRHPSTVQDVDGGWWWCDDGSTIRTADHPCSLGGGSSEDQVTRHVLFHPGGCAGGLSSLRSRRRGLALVDMLFTLGDAAGFWVLDFFLREAWILAGVSLELLFFSPLVATAVVVGNDDGFFCLVIDFGLCG